MISFTIITCTYNAGGVLKRTLDSVLSQTYGNMEHLIIDGASSDSTLSLVDDYKKEDAECSSKHIIRVVSEKDGGLYYAMNKAIDMVDKDYLVFLNAGDIFSSNDTLQRIAESVPLNEEMPAVLYGDTDIVDDNGAFLRHRRLTPPSKLSWKSFKWGMLVCHQSFYVNSELAGKVHYNTKYHYSADIDWCIRVMKEAENRGMTLQRLNFVVTNYLDGGMSVKNHKASLHERFSVMRENYGLAITIFMHILFVLRAVIKK